MEITIRTCDSCGKLIDPAKIIHTLCLDDQKYYVCTKCFVMHKKRIEKVEEDSRNYIRRVEEEINKQ